MRYSNLSLLFAGLSPALLSPAYGFLPSPAAISISRREAARSKLSVADVGSSEDMKIFFADAVRDDDGAPPDATDEEEALVDWDWVQMSRDVFTTDKRPIVLFDGICNLCNGSVNFAMDQDESANLRFASLQSKVAQSLLLRCGKSPTDTSSIVFVTEDDAFYSSDAVSHICMELDAAPLRWFGQLGQFTPAWVRESVYQFVSNNRYQFGESDSCRLDFDGTYTSRFVSDPMNNQDDAGIAGAINES